MITAVYLENPFKPQNRVIRQISAAEAPAVIDAVALLNANLSGEMILSVNGQKVAADHALKGGDFVVIAPNVLGGGGGGGKNIAGIVAGIALMAFSGGAGAGLLGILGTTQGALGLGVALYFGGALLMGNQKAPSVDAPRMQGAFENGYNWSPNQIRLQPGSPMPITFGTIRTSGQLIARRVWSAEFAGKQTQYLGLLLAAGEGPLTSITDIEINDTPIASIQGAISDVRLGTNNQNPVNIAGLGAIVEFQPFSSELPLSDSTWTTKTQTEPGDKITLDFVFPAGLYAVDTSSGATVACRGTIRWEYRETGAGSWITGGTNTYSQQARRPFYFTIDFTPPDKTKTYEFRAQNYSLKDFAATYGGGWTTATEMPSNYSVAISWVGLTVSTNYAQTYPGVALVAISLPATENLSGSMPKVSWKQTRATVNVWNPNTSQYEQRDAQNIAWMVYDLIHYCRAIRNLQTDVDDYVVFGEPKENLNYDAFSAWATFCAYEVSAGVQRAFGALLVDSAEQMWPAIQKIASTGRAFVIQQAGVFKPVWDSTRTMSQIFTSGNIIDGSLSGSFLPERERANAIEVSFINAENGYERDTLFVASDDYSPANMENTTQVFLPGITSPKIAYMWAKHQLKKNKYLKRTTTLQADIDSIVAELGDVVGIQSDITSWGVGGRIMGATTTSVVIDQAVTLAPGSTYSLLIRYPDNTLIRRVVDAVLVSTTTTTLNFTGAPWPTAPERYCVYSFGINTLEAKPFQITGIRRNGDLQATLELLEYVADVYTEATDFPVIDYTAANAGISSLTVKADSDTGKLGIAWTVPTDRDYTGSVVYVDGKPQGFFTTDVTDIDIDAPPGTHTVTVRPVDGSGNYGTETEEEVTLGSPTLSSVSAPSLSSTVRGQADGTNLVYITGTFTIPDLASSVLVEIGEGSNPAAWATVQDSRVAAVQYGPVLPGTLYTLRFTAKNRYATADPVLEPITTAGDTTAPNAPSIGVTSYLKTVKIAISLASVPSDMAGFAIYRYTSNNSAAASQIGSITSKDGRATYTDEAPAYGATLYYWVKSFDTWGNLSSFSSAGSTLITAINGTDIVDGALSRSALFQAGVVDAAAIASQAVTNAKLANDAVNTAQIAAGAITELKLANDAVTAAKLNVAAIDGVSGNIVTGAVGELQLAANAVTAAKIKAGEVGSTALAAGAVTELKIAAAAVTEAKIAAAAVNTAQLNNAALSMPAGPIARWSLKGATAASIAEAAGFRDVSGLGNHGQAVGGVLVSDTLKGKALYFDGIDDRVTLWNDKAVANWTIAGWFFRSDAAGNYGTLFARTPVGDWALEIETLASASSATQFRAYPTSLLVNNYSLNEWHHFVIARTSSSLTLYFDGILVGSVSHADLYALTSGLQMGNWSNGSQWFKGYATPPRIYDRALNAAEAKALYMLEDDAAFGNITADLLSTGELITKTAQIKDAIITSAKIDSLDAAKITTGTLAAARIATGSLAADKITGGALVVGGAAGDVNAGATTINGGKITASSVTASQLASDSVTTDKLAAGSVTAAKITSGELITLTAQIKDATITAAKTKDLSADKITAGTLAAARIAAGSLTADKITGGALVVGSAAGDVNAGATTVNGGKITANSITTDRLLVAAPGAALAPDPNFEDLTAWALAFGTIETLASGAASGNKVFRTRVNAHGSATSTVFVPIDPTRTYRRSFWARGVNGVGGLAYFHDIPYDANKTALATTLTLAGSPPNGVWTFYTAIVTYPATARYIKIKADVNNGTPGATVYTEVQDNRLEEVLPTTLIQDGAVTTDKLFAEAVTTAKLAAGAVTAEKMLIGKAGAALNDDPNFEDPSAWGIRGGNALVFSTTTIGRVGSSILYSLNKSMQPITAKRIPIDPAKQYRLRVWIYQNTTTSTNNSLTARYVNADGTLQGQLWPKILTKTTAGWEEMFVILTPPSNAVAVIVGADINYYGATISMFAQDFRLEEVLPATLIQDGAIITDKLAANAVTAAKVSAGAIETAALAAGAVTADKVSAGAITSDKLTSSQIVGKDIRTAENVGNGTVSGLKMTSAGLEGWVGASRQFLLGNNGWGNIYGFSIIASSIWNADVTYTSGSNTLRSQIRMDVPHDLDVAGHVVPSIKVRREYNANIHQCEMNNGQLKTTGLDGSNDSTCTIGGLGQDGSGANSTAHQIITLESTSYLAFYTNASIYIGNNCSALSFTDRTEMPESIEEALEIINTMQPIRGKVDYKRLSNKAKKFTVQKTEDGSEYIEEGRDLTKTVSALIMVCQKQQEEIIRLSDRLAKLEGFTPDEEREYIEAVDKVIGENRGNIRVRMEAGK